MILVLFAMEYPYAVSGEDNFVRPEMKPLSANFDQVILVPENILGPREQIDYPIRVEDSYATGYANIRSKAAHLRNALTFKAFWAELQLHPLLLRQADALKRLVVFASKSKFTLQWVGRFIDRNGFDPRELILYTYWFDASAFGIGLLKTQLPKLVFVSRAHGYDVYEDRHTYNYMPFRRRAMQTVDFLFPDSEAGTRYLVSRYPELTGRCETGRLGVPNPGFVTRPSQDGVFRIVSCSFLVPVKRLDLLVRGIEWAARTRPGQKFEWLHFGTGELRESLVQEAESRLPPSVKWALPGFTTIGDLMQYYRENPIDLFANVSRSEGTPVSIMEAISCGIPVMATAVGGNTEIVSEESGWLLSPNPTEQEIGGALLGLIDNPARCSQMRAASRQVWVEKYNAARNLEDFAKRLVQLRRSR